MCAVSICGGTGHCAPVDARETMVKDMQKAPAFLILPVLLIANGLKRQSTYFSRLYDTLTKHRGGALAQRSQ